MSKTPYLVLVAVAIAATLACTTTQVATPSVPDPTLTTPQPTAQLVANSVPDVIAQPLATATPEPTQAPTNTPVPEPTATPLPTNTPEPTPTPNLTPPPVLGSRENPVPIGQVVEILKADLPYWAFVVSDTKPDAKEEILSENMFNDPPEPGNQFYMVELEAKCLGPDSAKFTLNFSLKTVGQSGVV